MHGRPPRPAPPRPIPMGGDNMTSTAGRPKHEENRTADLSEPGPLPLPASCWQLLAAAAAAGPAEACTAGASGQRGGAGRGQEGHMCDKAHEYTHNL